MTLSSGLPGKQIKNLEFFVDRRRKISIDANEYPVNNYPYNLGIVFHRGEKAFQDNIKKAVRNIPPDSAIISKMSQELPPLETTLCIIKIKDMNSLKCLVNEIFKGIANENVIKVNIMRQGYDHMVSLKKEGLQNNSSSTM